MFYNEEYYTNCSGVKNRKKKKKVKEQDDIVSLNLKIVNKFNEIKENLFKRKDSILKIISITVIPYGVKQDEIYNMLKFNDLSLNPVKKISYKDYLDLIEEFKSINLSEVDLNFGSYITKSRHILEEYEKIIKNPKKVSFFSSSKDPNEEYLSNLRSELTKIAAIYFPEMSERTEEKVTVGCEYCGETDMIEQDNNNICNSCGGISSLIKVNCNYNDLDRVNFSKKYTYKKFIHFRDTIKNFQGIQNKTIDEKILKQLEAEFEKDGLINSSCSNKEEKYKKINKQHIKIYLDQIGQNKYYEDINLIYSHFTGKNNNIISKDLEEELMKDFDIFTKTFLSISSENNQYDINRTNILSSSYILFQLLKRRNYKCKEEDFSLPSSQKCRYEQEYIYSICCEKLGWNYVSIL
jgi:hypothetical protein